jgi:hypothetical protein
VSDCRLYVYYRIPDASAHAAFVAVDAAQRQLRAQIIGLRTELLRRPQRDAQAEWTWMEIYRRDEGVDAALQAAIESAMRAALAPWLPADARHVEVFEAFGPAATAEAPCA